MRMSTDGQSVENQLRELATVAQRHGREVVPTFTDEGVSTPSRRVAVDEV